MRRHALVSLTLAVSAAFVPVVAVAQAPNAGSDTTMRETVERFERRIGGLTIVEFNDDRISDKDVAQIRAELAPAVIWWMKVRGTLGAQGERGLSVNACSQPTVSTKAFRRGHCSHMIARGTAGWVQSGVHEFVQVAVGAGDAASQQPIEVLPGPNAPRLSNDTLIEIVTLLRRQAVATTTNRLTSDLQPWPIQDMLVSDTGILVTLRREGVWKLMGPRALQFVIVRRQGDKWTIVQLA